MSRDLTSSLSLVPLSIAETDQLERLAEEALKQISERAYARELEERLGGIPDIVRYGIAFSGKHAVVKLARERGAAG